MNKMVLQLVYLFMQRQMAKFVDNIDWHVLANDAKERIAKLLPGKEFDDAAGRLIETIILLAGDLIDNGMTPKKAFSHAVDKAGA